MNGSYRLLAVFLILGSTAFGQPGVPEKPKLIVGIVVDQMRFDQLYIYENKFSEGGFRRLVREGFSFRNTTYNYIPTLTAPGHASIYTGSIPAYHGIIGNFWFDRLEGRMRGNVEDAAETLVGTLTKDVPGASPRNLLTTTLSDELRLGTNFRSKVISISLKDRGAILPGGHSANAAYWFDTESSPGYFVTSTYYLKELPEWVTKFNGDARPDASLDTAWNTLFPIAEYTESAPDDNEYEPALGGKEKPVFPYDFKEMRSKYKARNAEYQLMLVSPEGNTLLTEFAMEAIKNEQLGMHAFPDMLTISFSSTDAVGHTFGPQSVELEDMYLRLDRNIETLLNYLDHNVGKGEYVLFLTADHGVLPVASYLRDHNFPTGVARISAYRTALGAYLDDQYGKQPWIAYFEEDQVYLDRELIKSGNLDLRDVQRKVAAFMLEQPGVHGALTAGDLQTGDYSKGRNRLLQNGYYSKRSGDILLTYDPGVVFNADSEIDVSAVKGTTHGTGYAYDRHVPLVWFGHGIPHGSSVRPVAPTDISPTLAMMLTLDLPSGNMGEPLYELIK